MDRTRIDPLRAKKTREELERALAEFKAKGNKIDKRKPGETNITPKVLMSTGLGDKK